MNRDTYARLLKDLQKLEDRLVKVYVARVRADADEKARVAERHRAAEVGGRLDDFIKLSARRSAVQLLLRTVYVRVLEDLGALDPPRIRGRRGLDAFRQVAPALGVRGYLRWTFRDLAYDFEALFSPGPDELDLPGEDLCREIWDLWHLENGQGALVYAWDNGDGEGFDSRFLGDLYQDLDAEVRKRYALLQTPDFVEAYILDHAMTPALDEFDPVELRAQGDAFRVLDPTCGSGHFLIGAFHRMADFWEGQGLDQWPAAERALESVWGADINAHAVDIARFRLLLEVRTRTGVTDIDWLAMLPLNLRSLDSLVPWEKPRQGVLFEGRDRLTEYATAEDREANAEFLGHDFHVVVGNPPYITPKDKQKRDDYREFWPGSAYDKYSMSAPFCDRFFDLGTHGAFTGQITANSFMKRQFGKSLIESVLPSLDLTGVVDTSGAYIPGHGTPTVILFGRSRQPVESTVWAILGKRGEPSRPAQPDHGLVWSAIVAAGKEDDDTSPFVSVASLEREAFETHPWSLEGGQAPSLQEHVESASSCTLGAIDGTIGNLTKTILDDVYFGCNPRAVRDRDCGRVVLVEGAYVRDWAVSPSANPVLFPYGLGSDEPLELERSSEAFRHFWQYRPHLWMRKGVGFKTVWQRGQLFYEFPFYFPTSTIGLGICFAEVATHNHFVLDRGGKVFKQTAPVIKLPGTATLEDHLDVLGLLNSSTLNFWARQTFYPKGGDKVGDGGRLSAESWSDRLQRDSTKLKKAPITDRDRELRVELAGALDATATERADCLPAAVLERYTEPRGLRVQLAEAHDGYLAHTRRMVALQEELDWLTYGSYALLPDDLEPAAMPVRPELAEPLAPGHRPFEIVAAQAYEVAGEEERSAWWSRHGHDNVTEVPELYSFAQRERIQARIDLIERDDKIEFLEQFAYKRRWQLLDWDKETKQAAERWLLDRLEDLFAPLATEPDPYASGTPHSEAGALSEPLPYRLERIVTTWQRDPRVAHVAAVWSGASDVDLTLVAEKLLRAEAIPDNPRRVYSAEGLRKLDVWKTTWALQDLEDAGETLKDPDTGSQLDRVPVPPQFKKGDFASGDSYKIRGKLNVPRERFILFADLTPQQFGWNGWRDHDRAIAQLEAYVQAEEDPTRPMPRPTADNPSRCGVTIGLWESLPDVRRWTGASEHAELHALVSEACGQSACPCAIAECWDAWQRGEREIVVDGTPESELDVTIEERSRVAKSLTLYGDRGARIKDIEPNLSLTAVRLETVLDDLAASGHVEVKGRGTRKRYILVTSGVATTADTT